MSIKVVIAENYVIFRRSLQLIIERDPEIKVVGETGNGVLEFHQIEQLSPDIVITDIDMFNPAGMDLTQQITSGLPHIKVIALLSFFDKHFILRTLKFAGASGYVLKNCSPEDILSAIHTVVRDNIFISTEIEYFIIKNFLVNPLPSNTCSPSLPEKNNKKIQQLVNALSLPPSTSGNRR